MIHLLIFLLAPSIFNCLDLWRSNHTSSLSSNILPALSIYERLYSENGKWYLILQDDGNVVGYNAENHEPFFCC